MTIWVLIYRISFAMIVAVVLVWIGSLFYPQFRSVDKLSNQQVELQEEIRRDEEILKHLRLKQQRLINDPRYVEKIAREELGLAKPGETVFKFIDDPSPLDAGNSNRRSRR